VQHFTGKGVLEGSTGRDRKGVEKKKNRADRYDSEKILQKKKGLECLERLKVQRWPLVPPSLLLLPRGSNEHYWDARQGKDGLSSEIGSVTLTTVR